MGIAPKTDPHSTFRTAALVISAAVAALLLLSAAAIARHGGDNRYYGWRSGRSEGRLMIVAVEPGSPADGRLQPGDELLAWNGDPRVRQLGTLPFGRHPRNVDYTLTVRREGVDHTIPLTATPRADAVQARWNATGLLRAFVWLVVVTMIALYRPELTVSRIVFAAGLALAIDQARGAVITTLPWLPEWWRMVLVLVVPVFPLQLALGYHFYLRFPPGVSTTPPWRAIRTVFYALCGLVFVYRLPATLADVLAQSTAVSITEALNPTDRVMSWLAQATITLGLAGIIAVTIRNYRAVQSEDDRRRVRWVFWGTVAGLAPVLVLDIATLVARIGGIATDLQQWGPVVNVAPMMIPISIGYAIIRHHVFDITFVLGRGLQYLLARNALRLLLSLPVVGLAYGLFVHRDQPIAQMLWTSSGYLYLIGAALLSLRFRTQLTQWVDRRFFREAYDRQRFLVDLIDHADKLESASGISKLVSRELESAFHPQCLFVWYREGDQPSFSLSYTSDGLIPAVDLSPGTSLRQLVEHASGIVELPLDEDHRLSRAERDWLDDKGVRLLVPMVGGQRHLAGLLMLGDKKSGEPYSSDDERLLQAIARQIALARDNMRLKDRVEQDRRLRHEVLAHLATGSVNVLKECPACGVCYDGTDTVCEADGCELILSLPVERTLDGKYRIERLIGKGGMGAVYQASDLRLSRQVAIKIMLGRAFGDRLALQRFEREAQACARLTHPNIITVFDFGAAGADGAFLAMELLEGRTLRRELDRRGCLPGVVGARVFEQICDGMAAAHQREVIHRDLKPENILMAATAGGGTIVKILDFGLAKILAAVDEAAGLTHPGVIMGTAGYMPPEQLTGGEIDERADVFAIGVMAAEVVTGRRPFRGRTPNELLISVTNEPVTLGGEDDERRRLESILRQATAAQPAQRYVSVTALAADLVPALRNYRANADDETKTAMSAEPMRGGSSGADVA